MIAFTKGHGTGNDFVIVDESVELTPHLVVRLCDRRFGLGGDGVLRVARSGELYFMDYWNSDGSIAEMCGNGLRVFVRYLLENGLATGPSIPVATRAGVRVAQPLWDGIKVDMGAPVELGGSAATVAGQAYDGLAVSMGNPHLVCDVDDVAKLDLSQPPGYDREFFPEGVNISFSERLAPDHVRMRVYERGSGETMSCGTGASAVGFAALLAQGRHTGSVAVDVPGGRLTVTVDSRTSWLTGPAVLVATGHIDETTL